MTEQKSGSEYHSLLCSRGEWGSEFVRHEMGRTLGRRVAGETR